MGHLIQSLEKTYQSGTVIAGEKAEAERQRLPLIGYETFGPVKAIFKSRSL